MGLKTNPCQQHVKVYQIFSTVPSINAENLLHPSLANIERPLLQDHFNSKFVIIQMHSCASVQPMAHLCHTCQLPSTKLIFILKVTLSNGHTWKFLLRFEKKQQMSEKQYPVNEVK